MTTALYLWQYLWFILSLLVRMVRFASYFLALLLVLPMACLYAYDIGLYAWRIFTTNHSEHHTAEEGLDNEAYFSEKTSRDDSSVEEYPRLTPETDTLPFPDVIAVTLSTKEETTVIQRTYNHEIKVISSEA